MIFGIFSFKRNRLVECESILFFIYKTKIFKPSLFNRKIEAKMFLIWESGKFRTRLLVPLTMNKKVIGSELLSYFPYLHYCHTNFSKSHIVRIGYFNYSHRSDERKLKAIFIYRNIYIEITIPMHWCIEKYVNDNISFSTFYSIVRL